jgi:uncharacterized protein YqhQ
MSGFHSGITTCFIVVPTIYTNWLTKKNKNAMKENNTNGGLKLYILVLVNKSQNEINMV